MGWFICSWSSLLWFSIRLELFLFNQLLSATLSRKYPSNVVVNLSYIRLYFLSCLVILWLCFSSILCLLDSFAFRSSGTFLCDGANSSCCCIICCFHKILNCVSWRNFVSSVLQLCSSILLCNVTSSYPKCWNVD